jgi:hypothetical protein
VARLGLALVHDDRLGRRVPRLVPARINSKEQTFSDNLQEATTLAAAKDFCSPVVGRLRGHVVARNEEARGALQTDSSVHMSMREKRR